MKAYPGPRVSCAAFCLLPTAGAMARQLPCPGLVNASRQVLLSKASSFDLNGFLFCQHYSKPFAICFVSSMPPPRRTARHNYVSGLPGEDLGEMCPCVTGTPTGLHHKV